MKLQAGFICVSLLLILKRSGSVYTISGKEQLEFQHCFLVKRWHKHFMRFCLKSNYTFNWNKMQCRLFYRDTNSNDRRSAGGYMCFRYPRLPISAVLFQYQREHHFIFHIIRAFKLSWRACYTWKAPVGSPLPSSTSSESSIAAVTKLHASRSQQNRTTLQHEQRNPGEWIQLRTRSVTKLATLYWCRRAAR
jgi:hypothetical protein